MLILHARTCVCWLPHASGCRSTSVLSLGKPRCLQAQKQAINRAIEHANRDSQQLQAQVKQIQEAASKSLSDAVDAALTREIFHKIAELSGADEQELMGGNNGGKDEATLELQPKKEGIRSAERRGDSQRRSRHIRRSLMGPKQYTGTKQSG